MYLWECRVVSRSRDGSLKLRTWPQNFGQSRGWSLPCLTKCYMGQVMKLRLSCYLVLLLVVYPFPNFNGSTVEVWEWISKLIAKPGNKTAAVPWPDRDPYSICIECPSSVDRAPFLFEILRGISPLKSETQIHPWEWSVVWTVSSDVYHNCDKCCQDHIGCWQILLSCSDIW